MNQRDDDDSTGRSVTTTRAAPLPDNPFQRPALPAHVNAGAVSIEQERAIAEAQGKLIMSKRFPRDPFRAWEAAVTACKRPGMAASAFYSFPRGGQVVNGATIRLAEELARCWGNIDYGIRELSRRHGVSEAEAYAWDTETNVSSSMKFTVRHWRDTTGGGVEVTSERDIYELLANMGSRRLRARILAILPDDYVDAAVRQCRATIAGDVSTPIADRITRTIGTFAKVGVTVEQLEIYLRHELKLATADELTDLHGAYMSIKEGHTRVSDWFSSAAAAAADATAGQQTKPDRPAGLATIVEPAKPGEADGERVRVCDNDADIPI